MDENGWLDEYGWEIVNIDTGLSWTGGPGKLCLHTTEPVGATMAGLISTFTRNPSIASHMGICWKTRRKVQFISLLHSAKSLRNLPGGIETNRDQVFQIEIVGSWVESADIPTEGKQFIAECIADVYKATGGAFKLELGHLEMPGPNDGFTARVNSPFRYTPQEWDDFNGVAGHGNVPENEHTDPGKLDMDFILTVARNLVDPIIPKPKGERMFEVMKNTDGRMELLQLGDDGYIYSSWQQPDGSLSGWRMINPKQPAPFVKATTMYGKSGELVVIANVAAYGGVPFICSQSAPSTGPWTDWVNYNELLKWLAATQK